MPRKKVKDSEKEQVLKSVVGSKDLGSRVSKLSAVLVNIFLIIWIIIGLFALAVIIQGYRKGAYSGLFSTKQEISQSAPEVQTPKDVDLPGVGKVNVECARGALTDDSLRKLAQAGNAGVLSSDEKTKFEPCIVEKPNPSPAASATP